MSDGRNRGAAFVDYVLNGLGGSESAATNGGTHNWWIAFFHALGGRTSVGGDRASAPVDTPTPRHAGQQSPSSDSARRSPLFPAAVLSGLLVGLVAVLLLTVGFNSALASIVAAGLAIIAIAALAIVVRRQRAAIDDAWDRLATSRRIIANRQDDLEARSQSLDEQSAVLDNRERRLELFEEQLTREGERRQGGGASPA